MKASLPSAPWPSGNIWHEMSRSHSPVQKLRPVSFRRRAADTNAFRAPSEKWLMWYLSAIASIREPGNRRGIRGGRPPDDDVVTSFGTDTHGPDTERFAVELERQHFDVLHPAQPVGKLLRRSAHFDPLDAGWTHLI